MGSADGRSKERRRVSYGYQRAQRKGQRRKRWCLAALYVWTIWTLDYKNLILFIYSQHHLNHYAVARGRSGKLHEPAIYTASARSRIQVKAAAVTAIASGQSTVLFFLNLFELSICLPPQASWHSSRWLLHEPTNRSSSVLMIPASSGLHQPHLLHSQDPNDCFPSFTPSTNLSPKRMPWSQILHAKEQNIHARSAAAPCVGKGVSLPAQERDFI